MRLSGAFLAEAAAAVDNKLNVQGGVLARCVVGPDRLTRFILVVLTLPDDDDSNRRVDVELTPPTPDPPIRMSFEVPDATLSEFPGFAFFGIDVALPSDGRWMIDVTSGGEGVSIPLVVSALTPPAPFGI
jgi:hypothetical protein